MLTSAGELSPVR